jgi:chromosome segregation ATPase
MLALTLSTLLAATIAFAQNPPAPVQTTETAVVAELTALRKSVDQLVDVMKLYAQQSADRDTALILSQLIDMDERRIAQMQQRLDGLLQSRAAIDTEMAQMSGSVETYTRMAAGDPTGKAQAMMAQEKARTAEQLEQKANAKLQLDNQISQLEGEISSRKQTVQEMRQRLDQKIKLTPQP